MNLHGLVWECVVAWGSHKGKSILKEEEEDEEEGDKMRRTK